MERQTNEHKSWSDLATEQRRVRERLGDNTDDKRKDNDLQQDTYANGWTALAHSSAFVDPRHLHARILTAQAIVHNIRGKWVVGITNANVNGTLLKNDD